MPQLNTGWWQSLARPLATLGRRQPALQKKRLRVLYIVTNFPQISQTYIKNEIEALASDYDISLVSLSKPNVPYKKCVPFRQIADPAEIYKVIEEFQPDVLHSHYLVQWKILNKLIEEYGSRIPFTIRAHSFDTLTGTSEIARSAAPLINHELCLGLLSFPFTRPLLERAGIRSEKIVDCFPVVNYPRFFDRSPNGDAVMNIGAAIPKKRMQDFIDLAVEVPEVRFDLYGVGHIVNDLAAYNDSRGARVTMMPPIEPDDMPGEYKKHRWLVYTACRDLATVGWPMAVAEAQASGVGVCMPNLRPDLADYVGTAGILYNSVSEVVEVVKGPVPDDMREKGFEQARKSNIFEHKTILTDLWHGAAGSLGRMAVRS